MLLQVHDELDEVTDLVRTQMGAAGDHLPDGPLDVPLDVSVGTGPSWFAAAH
jgi:DNA polymerase-1